MNRGPGTARRAEWIWIAAILALAAAFYGWTATSAGSPLTFKLQSDDLYNRLADGFLAGHLGFAEPAPPELAQLADPYDPAQNAPYNHFHDVSYYKGRYYLYFGPVPALVLLAPWKALTGTYLPQNLAVAVFAWGAALLGCLLVRDLRARHFPALPSWVVVGGAAAVSFGNILPILLRRPVFYELAIAGACCFGLGALWCFHRALTSPRRPRAWLAAASLALGLAVACRPNFLFGAGSALGIFLWLAWRREGRPGRREWRRLRPTALAAGLPIGAVGCALLAYNYARFEDWKEFGMWYELAGRSQLDVVFVSLRMVPINFYYYFLARPQFSAFFPFFQVTGFSPYALPKGYAGEENVYGVLVTLPLLWALGWLAWGLWKRAGERPGELRSFSAIAAGLIGCNTAFCLMIVSANNRYMVDFITPAVPVAFAGVMVWELRKPDWIKWAGRAAWTTALAYTVLFNVFVSFQHNDLLRFHNPAGYRRLAHAFNHVSGWLGATAPDRTGPLRVRLVLPAGRTGQLEPLVVTGLSFRADFLWIYYVDKNHIKIGFEHTSYGGPVSPSLEVALSAEHTLDVAMGSLYPPIEHPYYDGMPPDRIAQLKHTLRVSLDGREVLSGTYDFYDSSPGAVAVGRNPVSDAFGRHFTGTILAVTRPGAAGLH